MVEHFDLIVIGGGPGGSTLATFVAMQGHRVLLLERELLPVYKIGESLLPATVNGICAMLGVTDELKSAGFVVKQGGTFRWGRNKEPWTFAFSLSSKLRGPTSFAYQVERMKFDTILLNNARRKGVDVRERHAAIDVLLDDNQRVTGVAFRDAAGRHIEGRSRFVVDASGWSTTLARHVGTRIYSQHFRNVAVFGYFSGAKRLPPPNSGNIFCAAFDRGWFWYIPLSDTLTSVGAVIGQESSRLIGDGREVALSRFIQECEPIRELLAGATRVTSGPYGEVRVRTDYSYCHDKFWKPGLALVGDSACFIDPVFSSGVHLATYSALLAARSINSCLGASMTEERAFGEFERRYMREFRYFYDFLLAFYDLDQDLDSYYWSARKVLNSAELGNEAFIQLVAGVGGSGEQLFESHEEFVRQRAGLGSQLFGEIPGQAEDAVSGMVKSGSGRFMTDLFREVSQVQSQATFTTDRVPEMPLFNDGLVPSTDGFHWVEPAVRRSHVVPAV